MNQFYPVMALFRGCQAVIANERSECGNLGKIIKNDPLGQCRHGITSVKLDHTTTLIFPCNKGKTNHTGNKSLSVIYIMLKCCL